MRVRCYSLKSNPRVPRKLKVLDAEVVGEARPEDAIEAAVAGVGDGGEEDSGPRRPKVERPNTDDLLRRMRKVDPNQARRYRQRTGQ